MQDGKLGIRKALLPFDKKMYQVNKIHLLTINYGHKHDEIG
jgi:hypothetical protein